MGSKAGQRLETSCTSRWIKFALIGLLVTVFVQGALGDVEPTESQCRPYIEKALKEQHVELEEKIFEETVNSELNNEQDEFSPTDELTDSTEGSPTTDKENDDNDDDEVDEAAEREGKEEDEDRDDENEDTKADSDKDENIDAEEQDDDNDENKEENESGETDATEMEEKDDKDDEKEEVVEGDSEAEADTDDNKNKETETDVADDDDDDMLNRLIDIEVQDIHIDSTDDNEEDDKDDQRDENQEDDKEKEESDKEEEDKVEENDEEDEESDKEKEEHDEVKEGSDDEKEENDEEKEDSDNEKEEDDEKEEDGSAKTDSETDEKDENEEDEKDDDKDSELENKENDKEDDDDEQKTDEDKEESGDEKVDEEDIEETKAARLKGEAAAENEEAEEDTEEAPEEEELIKEVVIPENLRPRDHIDKILRLEDSAKETLLEKTIDTALKGLKTLYDNAIKPLEILYKYRDLSNRHFGDPEIFSKPLILFMGPWSGGKSSTINYLLDNEFSHSSLRTGAEPSPAYFNILMHGEEEEILDGTQLAADWTFSGLQKFGQSLLDRLRGIKMPNKLLEKVNIVEIPGILEIRKQVQRLFPFNDACQWFIDRADIIFLIYDPSKLDVGPETEAILDQLKGREYQTRIILNKADQVKPEELMRVQGTLIWNISPLMSSSEPPIMYSTSLWSLPYEVGAPTRLLQAQERAFLRDLREAIDKRVENKIASARRFAVRVRNHAKMVDCYLTTYYNHKSIFGNRKKISDDIIEYPQKYHIYEGLSTLTNISRYDLPDPDVYRDFFKINPLYEFKKLSETCTYFRGCPINKLDVAIAYDLPELVGKYKKTVEATKEQQPKENS